MALITLDPALERWIEPAAREAGVDMITLRPADVAMADRLQADVVLVHVEPGNERDLCLIEEMSRNGARPVALATGGSINLAVAAMRRGACDFVLQPARASTLFERLADWVSEADGRERAQQRAGTRAGERADATGARTDPREGTPGFIGDTPAMIALYEQIRRIAPSSAPAFITGESGTGKEVCAAEIHRQSGRPAEKFVAINCAAIPHELMESELFGHVRGAFTGAGEDRPGAMQLADGGTLFLDEICEMDLALQAKLLRALQMKSVRRVGASADESVDVRIVCATNRDPQAEVNARRFRADLFYRLHVLPLHLPPLRERGDDIMKLANAFLKRYSAEENRGFTGFSPQARQFLQSYDWPGNVRQLENLVRRIVVMHDGETVEADMIPLALAHAASPPSSAPAANANDPGPPARGARTGGNGSQGSRASAGAGAQSPIEPFWMQERRIIESALEACGGHVGQAAAALGISASTIYRKKMSWDANAVLSA